MRTSDGGGSNRPQPNGTCCDDSELARRFLQADEMRRLGRLAPFGGKSSTTVDLSHGGACRQTLSGMRWPDGFMWGSGASSTQCEGAAPASDWWDWERAGRAPQSLDGNGFSTRFAEDFRLLGELGLT